MKRFTPNKRRSRRQFNSRANKTSRLNKRTSYRGGIRL